MEILSQTETAMMKMKNRLSQVNIAMMRDKR